METLILPILFGMIVVWFVLVKCLLVLLEHRHTKKYIEMGRPSLVMRNHLEGNLAVVAFLFGRQHRGLKDPALSKLSDAMLAFFLFYLIVLAGSMAMAAGSR